MNSYDVAIIGGGLAGLVNAIQLAKGGLSVILFEKKSYPFHRVCGEYVSNEVVSFLERNNLFPKHVDISTIKQFMLTSTNGRMASIPLELGGFGISRYTLDDFLYQKAKEVGVTCNLNTTVEHVEFDQSFFRVGFGKQSVESRIVIGSYGKRSTLDKKLKRGFMLRKSPYMGVKYHIKTDFPKHTIALHNFKDGYCGMSSVEGGSYNLCYLSHRNNIRKYLNIQEMEQNVMLKNPFLKSIFTNSDFLFEKPLVINEINFEHKRLVENHILMCGDAAGMITPLCGNGMAMAIHSAKVLSEIILTLWSNGNFRRQDIERQYVKTWNRLFYFRVWSGRKIQNLFGAESTSNFAVNLMKIKPVAKAVIRQTHGKVF